MLSRVSRSVLSSSVRSLRVGRTSATAPAAIYIQHQASRPFQQSCRGFQSSPSNRKGIFPDSADPPAPNPQSHNVAGAAAHVTEPSPLTDGEYHEYAEHYLNVLQNEVEKVQEEGFDLEAEYSAGVLNIIVPGVGTYVLNKQPPNKQIWLSSPISGPKRFDWVVEGDQMHEKQDTRPFVNGQWIYLRDGTNLTDLLNAELTLKLPKDVYSEIDE
ncbi:frataxin family protein [Aspergillus clavatus NRRL 1]|uniref:ferroxidase n=1 Tax=Aspergillus clavatus (strain ATCC 1007 / CBS 513.65 / DSM 816 / NCTC 3887 / NRRL 1 / QM 1276 / 107) TaxID=344612 RepID=A1CHZ4_ASPCL|nr:mitochondrial chaperone Frataxin, putative [Aspergillus clavatus NRRL 1]EAW10499.1 mitochondrial chaperone Frataxin, putative [Aspergillus clavatus NRRL 1]